MLWFIEKAFKIHKAAQVEVWDTHTRIMYRNCNFLLKFPTQNEPNAISYPEWTQWECPHAWGTTHNLHWLRLSFTLTHSFLPSIHKAFPKYKASSIHFNREGCCYWALLSFFLPPWSEWSLLGSRLWMGTEGLVVGRSSWVLEIHISYW